MIAPFLMFTNGSLDDTQNTLGMHRSQAVSRIEIILSYVVVGCCHQLGVHRSQRGLCLGREGLIAAYTDLILGREGKILLDVWSDAGDKGQLFLILLSGIIQGHAGNGGQDSAGQRFLKRSGGELIRRSQSLQHGTD